MNVKSLIGVEENQLVKNIYSRRKIFAVQESDTLDDVLNQFIDRKIHIAYVINDYKTLIGIVTLEDLVEEIIKEEIVDETDNHFSMREQFKKNNKK